MSLITKDIIFKYIAGQATVIQKRLIEEWLQSSEHQEIFYECMEEWEQRHPQFIPDTEAALIAYQKRLCNEAEPGKSSIAGEEEKSYRLDAVRPRNRQWLWYAAALLVISLGTAVFKDNIFYRHYTTAADQIKTVLLPDSSRVIILGSSDLKLARTFNWKKDRTVWLKGQAIFNVQHTSDNRAFFVNTPFKTQIQVLGTEFDLYASSDSTRIFLNEGSVRINMDSAFSAPVIMKPGDLVKVGNSNTVQIRNNQFYWQFRTQVNHTLVFNKTPLSDVALIMKEQFGKTVHIPDTALGNRMISGSYKWTTEKDILNTLALMMNFTVTYENNEAVLK